MPIIQNKKRGHVIMFAVVLFVTITLSMLVGITSPIVKYISLERGLESSKKSYFLAENSLEDATRRLQMGFALPTEEVQSVGGGTVTISAVDISSGKEVVATANVNSYIRKVKTNLILGQGVSFHYGVQAGEGGFHLSDESSVNGNIYSDGPVIGVGNTVTGDAVSAGLNGLIEGLNVKNSAYAHTIRNSIVDKDVFYKTILGTSVGRDSYPDSNDQSVVPLPISDALIAGWENDAASGGIISSPCPYVIQGEVTLGSKKISCDVEIKGTSTVLTLDGPVWVAGNILIHDSPVIKISSILGNRNVALIADDPTDRSSGGKMELRDKTTFQNSGSVGSYVFLISGNDSAEKGGSVKAISIEQGVGTMVAYASHGLISLENNILVREATAHRVNLGQSASITYDIGLPAVLFKAGSSGDFNISDWGEVF